MDMKLMGSRTSPYVRKVRIVLGEKGIDCPLIEDDVWGATPQIGRFNPLGKVPCLLLGDGGVVYDSRVIVEYLDAVMPSPRLIPEDARQRAEVRTLEALADGVMDAAVAARLEQAWPGRAAGERSQAWVQRQLGKIEAALPVLAARLDKGPWLCGSSMSLADVAAVTALDYLSFRVPQIAWRSDHPALAGLRDRLDARPSFHDTLPPQPSS